jgi:hypothetical protein
MRTPNIFHKPLKAGDTPEQTVGCRHTNPDICAKNALPKVCGLVRPDGICQNPPQSWKKQYKQLQRKRT